MSATELVTDNSVRIKVTNDCQWTCNFCHNEGTELPTSLNAANRVSVFLDPNINGLPPVGDIPVNSSTLDKLRSLKGIGIDEVHLTGGEPTLHPDLPQLISELALAGFTVRLTTNGQSSPKRLTEIIQAGVSSINFSVLSLDPEQFLQTQNPPSIPGLDPIKWASRMIEREKSNITLAKSLGVNVKINTAVLGPEDFPRVDSVREFADQNDITLVLLNGVGEGDHSQQAVFEYAQRNATLIGAKESLNNGKGSRMYALPSGNELRAKYLTDYHPEVVCGGCVHNGKPSCVEKFYGIRMEFRGGEPYTRLCLQQSNERTVMPLTEFMTKDIRSQL